MVKLGVWNDGTHTIKRNLILRAFTRMMISGFVSRHYQVIDAALSGKKKKDKFACYRTFITHILK